MSKIEYGLQGLNCASCASKIEVQVSELEEVQNVNIEFTTGRLTIESSEKSEVIIEKIRKIVKAIEPDVRIVSNGDNETGNSNVGLFNLGVFVVSLCLMAVSFLTTSDLASFILFALSALLSGYKTMMSGIKSLFKFRMDENTLMLIAVVAAFIIGEGFEGAMVMLLYLLGNIFEDAAGERSRREIRKLSLIRPDNAYIKTDEGLKEIDAQSVQVGTEIIIKPYDRIPLDGIILSGDSTLDTSAITGESAPVDAFNGKEVLSGMLNGQGELIVKTTAEYGDSAASRILKMVEQASSNKGESQKFITRFAAVYTPIVTVMAILLATVPPLMFGDFKVWLYRALVFLVASCPCALVISVPLAFFAGIGGATKKGILIKGGRYTEILAKAKSVVFDKTGTLTTGKQSVKEVYANDGYTKEEVLKLAAIAEARSSHPVAKAIVEAYGEIVEGSREYSEEAGFGVSFTENGKTVRCGSKRLMDKYGVDILELPKSGVYVSVDEKAVGCITLSDSVRTDALSVSKDLKLLGIEKIYMLTGDNKVEAQSVASQCDIGEFHAELLPEQKVERLNEIKSKSSPVLFVGDGINDAPVLATADAGIAMGLGTDAAIEAADIVLVGNSLDGIAKGIKLSRRTMSVVKANIIFSLSVKAVVLILAAIGYAPMLAAVFADVGVSLITVLNSTRLLKSK